MTRFQKLANASILCTIFACLTTASAVALQALQAAGAPTPLLALLSGVTALACYCTVMLPTAFLWDTEA